MACSACAPLIALQYDISPSLMWWGGLLYWLAALVTLLWAASQIQALKKLDLCHQPDTGRTTGAQQQIVADQFAKTITAFLTH